METYAQNNLQLYNQLRAAGRDTREIDAVANSYRLAMQLFSGLYRTSGKPFVEHVVGTASVLVAHEAPMPLVHAGLLHAAYASGDFGGLRPGMTASRRRQVRDVTGAEVEQLVARYQGLRWSAKTTPGMASSVPAMDALTRNALLVRLANEIDECTDFGIAYSGPKLDRFFLRNRPFAADCARALERPALAAELETAFAEMETFRAHVSLPNHPLELYDHRVVSGSYWLKPLPLVRSGLRRAVRNARKRRGEEQ